MFVDFYDDVLALGVRKVIACYQPTATDVLWEYCIIELIIITNIDRNHYHPPSVREGLLGPNTIPNGSTRIHLLQQSSVTQYVTAKENLLDLGICILLWLG